MAGNQGAVVSLDFYGVVENQWVDGSGIVALKKRSQHCGKADSGFLLGGEAPGVAEVVTVTRWSTMADRLRRIEVILEEVAPMTAFTRRVMDLPALAGLAAEARRDCGDAYYGGEIEVSLRKVLEGPA